MDGARDYKSQIVSNFTLINRNEDCNSREKVDTAVLTIMYTMVVSSAAVRNYHQFRSLKHKFSIIILCMLEIQHRSHWPEIKA